MANTIQIKRSTGTTAPTNLAVGELAHTQGGGTQGNGGDRLYIGEGSNVQEVIGGKYFTDLLDHVHGTLTASSALVADSASRVSEVIVGNNATAGGKVQFREGTNNGNHYVAIQGPAAASGTNVMTLQDAADTLVGRATTDTLTNKTLTTPTLTTPVVNTGISLKNGASSAGYADFYEDSDNGTNRVRLIGPSSTADVSVILPAAADTLVGKATTDVFTNKSYDLGGTGNVLTGSIAEFNIALQSDSFATLGGTETISGIKTFSGNPIISTIDSTGAFTVDAATDINLDAGGSDIVLKTAGTQFGGLTNAGGQLVIKSSSSNTTAATFSGSNVTFAGTVGSGAITSTGNVTSGAAFIIGGSSVDSTELGILDGATVTTAELNKLASATVTTAEINILDGDTSASSVGVIDGDRVIMNDGGTMKQVAVTDLSAYFDDEITAMPNLITTAATTVGALDSGSITSNFGTINNGASTITTTGAITGGSLAVDDLSVNGQTISTTGSNKDVIISPHGSGDIDASSSKIINVTDPTQAQDAATKAYVDATKQGLDVKDSCRVATTGNITIADDLDAGDTIDGVTLVAGDRVLVKNQSTGSQNGIYVSHATTPFRATDFDASSEVTSGLFTFVEEGTVNSDSGWVLTTDGAITLGTTDTAYTQFSGAGQITAGAGLIKNANTINAVGTASRITVNADSIDIHASYVGQTTITLLGIIGTGVWQGTTVAVGYGGTGLASFAAGNIMYATGSTTLAKLAPVADGILIMNAGATAPTWSTSIDGGTF